MTNKLCLRKYRSPFFIVWQPDGICMHAALVDRQDARVDLYIELYLYITYIELVNASLNRWEHSHIIAKYRNMAVVLMCPLTLFRLISLFFTRLVYRWCRWFGIRDCKVWKVYCVGWGSIASDQNVWLNTSFVWRDSGIASTRICGAVPITANKNFQFTIKC